MTKSFRFWLVATAFLLSAGPRLFGATEAQDFNAAAEAFNDTMYARAEKGFAEFAQKYPASPRLPEAILLRARSRLEQSNYTGAIELLSANENAPGARKDEFLFWTGETRLREGKYAEANKIFGQVVNGYASSPMRLGAAVKQGMAMARLGDWKAVVDLLGPEGGAFQSAARTNGGSDAELQGYLLLAEAQVNRTNYAPAEAILKNLGKRVLNDTNAWAWNYLLCRVQLGSGQAAAALDTTTNLTALALRAGLPNLQAESAAFRAKLLEGMGRLDEAVAAYTNNLSSKVSAERQRQAIGRIAQLSVAGKKTEEAARSLEGYLAQNPPAAAADVGWVELGELRMRQFVEWLGAGGGATGGTNAAAATNHLEQAIAAFETVAKQYAQSPLLGTNLMDLGWCYWLQDKFGPSRQAFQGALEHLAPGSERVKAHFKLGDAQFREKDYAGAITNYTAVLAEGATVAEARTNLFEPALYQTVRAGLAGGDLSAASNALSKVQADYPTGFYTAPAVLLFGQQIGKDGSPAQARAVFEEFVKKAPESGLRSEVELAISRTYEQEDNWLKAMERYADWLKTHTNHTARADAAYYLAQATYYAGNETNAYGYFTNFVAEYPKHALAAQARRWVADYYFNAGAYRAAENDYQIIAHDWPGTKMAYQALMGAGRAAFARQGWSDAIDYFYTKLAGDTNCPAELHFQALFAYGDTLMSQDSTNKPMDYERARAVFDAICQQYSTNHLAVRACGEKANCLLQLARSSAELTNAVEAFNGVLTNAISDGVSKSIARVGLGVVLEKQAAAATGPEQKALRLQALDDYLNVLYGTDLNKNEGDEFWTKVAGKEAVRLASEMQEWVKVVKICERIAEKLPQIAPLFEEQKRKAENITRGK